MTNQTRKQKNPKKARHRTTGLDSLSSIIIPSCPHFRFPSQHRHGLS